MSKGRQGSGPPVQFACLPSSLCLHGTIPAGATSRQNGAKKAGEEFSFCDVVGQPSAADGYKEAHAFVDGEIVNAIGGGNCQVSTTIYNAAKKIDGVKITERHEHDKPVGYIEMGKDATVAYDYLDLKFENNNDFDLELEAYIEDDEVCVDIYKIA